MVLNVRYLPWMLLATTAGVAAAAWATGSLQAPSTALASNPGRGDANAAERSPGREMHPVTPRQLAEANALARRTVADLVLNTHDGGPLTWERLSGGRPVVLVFVKNGCPCSGDLEPFYRRVESLYGGVVCFAEVIDGDVTTARRHAAERAVPHPIIADAEQSLIRRLGAENGSSVALLTADGVLDGFWPGCSADGMRDLARRAARLAGVAERPLDIAGMPAALTTGCPFH
jgi:hypothetical protein